MRTTAIWLFALLLQAGTAHADLVFLTGSTRPLSVRSHRFEGTSVVLALRAGGEIVCDRALVERIEPDEVPYPDDVRAVVAAPAPIGGTMPVGDLVDLVSAQEGVDARLVHAVIRVESAYQPRALSPKGAMGLMQLMPETARQYGVRDPYDPRANIEAGVRHLKMLLQRFDVSLALAAYNAGEGAIQKYGGIPPYRETRDYVSRILELVGQRQGARPEARAAKGTPPPS
jgi:hypothetical protein